MKQSRRETARSKYFSDRNKTGTLHKKILNSISFLVYWLTHTIERTSPRIH